MKSVAREPADVKAVLASTVADERLRIVATIIGRTGDWELAEDSLQDAIARALRAWPEQGIPASPGAWLTTAARNAAIDAVRRAAAERAAKARVAIEVLVDLEEERSLDFGFSGGTPQSGGIEDDRLRLIFTCCHPALTTEARVALTLRTVVGLEVSEIARAFLVTEPAMQKRLVRTRAKIREAAIPYLVPEAEELPERTGAVLAVVYLLFTEGYSGGSDVTRPPLAEEAIRLARLLSSLMSNSAQLPEVLGLLALMLFQHSRTAARSDESGDLVLLEDQDRGQWNSVLIAEGVATLIASESARQRLGSARGPYQLQAEIAFQHATAPSFEMTDFARVAALYAQLSRVAPTPVVNLQRAIAVGLADGPEVGLALLDTLGGAPLESYHLFHAARADLLRRTGRGVEALPHYARALELASTDPERRYLAGRIERLRGASA